MDPHQPVRTVLCVLDAASDEGCGSGQVLYVDWSVVLLCKSRVCVLVPLKYFDKSLWGRRLLTVERNDHPVSGPVERRRW